jgi:hypothetical protein
MNHLFARANAEAKLEEMGFRMEKGEWDKGSSIVLLDDFRNRKR